ncbi:hypothetical protein MMPV_008445 [Pyropia vietnamensis]
MSGSYKSYRVEVGPIPDMTDVPGWAEAWGREVARGWTQTTWAHHVFKALDHASPGNAFVKQMAALPDAGMPDDTDRSDSITVVRRPSEVGYMRHYEEVKQLLTDDDLQAPTMDYVVMKPPYIGRSTNYPTHATLTHCRNQRTTRVGFLVGWHQAEFPSCPVPLRAGLYVRVPAWWPSVEVPYGAMVEVPPVQAYAAKELMNRDTLALNVLRSEWAVLAGAFLLESYRARNILWLYPPVLCQWILRVGSSFICQGEDGHDEEAAEELEALLTLLPNVPSGPAFTQHLRQLDPVRRDRSSWVRVVILRRGTIEALVDEDLHPYEMPYSAEVMDNRAMSSGADGWSRAVSTAHSPGTAAAAVATGTRNTNIASGTPGTPNVARVAPSVGPSPVSTEVGVVPLVMPNLPLHRDVRDSDVDDLWNTVTDSLGILLSMFFGASPRDLTSCHSGPVVAALLHVMVRRGEGVRDWVARQQGLNPRAATDLLRIMGRETLSDLFRQEVETAEQGWARRAQAQHQAPRVPTRNREEERYGEPGPSTQRRRYDRSNW